MCGTVQDAAHGTYVDNKTLGVWSTDPRREEALKHVAWRKAGWKEMISVSGRTASQIVHYQ